MQKVKLSNKDVFELSEKVSEAIALVVEPHSVVELYGIPRGGISAMYAVIHSLREDNFIPVIAEIPEDADFFIDDIIDSGATMERYCDAHPGIPFLALVDKTEDDCPYLGSWVEFPWEVNESGDSDGIEDNVRRLLQFAGENPDREGLLDTPKRFQKAWLEYTSGYRMNPADVLKTFADGAESSDELVIVADIPFYSMCEHHLATIMGKVTIGYIPNGKVVGLSKLKRLADVFAKRLQVQERMTNQIADALVEHLDVQGCGVIVEARHMCMETRGVSCNGHHTVTKAFRGQLKENHNMHRRELINTVYGDKKCI